MSAEGFFHCSVKSVGRAAGRSAVAAAAYRAAEVLHDERTGLTHHYGERSGVVTSFIVAPDNAPAWAQDRERLWNAAEVATAAKNGRIATELELALPHELDAAQRLDLARRFAVFVKDKYGVAVDTAIHAPGKGGDSRNHHAHMMLTHRELGADGFGEICNRRIIERKVKGERKAVEVSGLTNSADVQEIRKEWAAHLNAAYERAGLDIRADHRSHQDRGLTAEPTKHLGPSASAMERRGEATDRGDVNRGINARNADRARIEEQRLSLQAAIAEMVAEREARADRRELRAAVRSTSSDRILEAVTEKRATFTRAELTRLLRGAVEERQDAADMATELLAHPDVIGLRETADGKVTRYTTRTVLAEERAILADARTLAEQGGRGLSERQRHAALMRHKHLDEEQRAAFEQTTAGRGLSIIAGEAGTGKSTTLAAIRDGYESAGYRVIGLAWTNSVIQDMAADGFRETSTIAAALGRIERSQAANDWHMNRKGQASRKVRTFPDGWNSKTVLVVDEAAMLSSRHLGRVLDAAKQSGARVILTGDDKQLASIERGGMFGALVAEHGAAELHTVYRVQDQAQARAYNHMHGGRFREALDIFDAAKAINWTETQDEARTALVAQWAKDTKEAPGKSRFVFAYSNKDVDALNADLRAIRRERGELGEDHNLKTAYGPANFAAGDRIQFTGSGYGREAKARGLVTGGMGVIREIDGQRVTVDLDGKSKRSVTFTVGEDEQAGQFDAFRHGYAGTIYKGQGRTLDQTYLYHSESWRASSAYVALSRHREKTALFVAREVTRGREPWMMKTGGYDELSDAHKARAEEAYQLWAEENPQPAAKYGVARYVAYVQGKQAERGRSEYDMSQLTRQISRMDETRAASQFLTDEQAAQKPTGTAGGKRPRLSGPNLYAALKEEARRMVKPVMDPIAALLGRREKDADRAAKLAELRRETETAPKLDAKEAADRAALLPDLSKLPPATRQETEAERTTREALLPNVTDNAKRPENIRKYRDLDREM